MTTTLPPLRIIELRAENVKKLRAVVIRPDTSVVQITGANGSGKSSLLDAIYWALAGTKGITSQPVRQGEDRAVIRLDLGEIVVTRTIRPDGETRLTVEAANGARYPSPQRMLDDLFGALTFDPLAFARMDPKAQLEQLRGLVTLDVDLDEIDRETKRAFDDRTELGRRVRELEARLANAVVPAGLPEAAVDVSALLAAMQAGAAHNEQLAASERDRAATTEQARNRRESARVSRERADALLRDAERLELEAGAIEIALANSPALGAPVDLAEIRAQIDAARAANEGVAKREERERLRAELRARTDELDALTTAIELGRARRADAIARAVFPVPALSFGEGEVLYRDLPFGQASSAEQLRVSVALAMAANPRLRVLRIKDGSLLDERSLALIADLAEREDYQVWIERVDVSGRVGVVIEDGSVVSPPEREDAPLMAAAPA